jgi:cytochrome c oxidase assembly protein Cox11
MARHGMTNHDKLMVCYAVILAVVLLAFAAVPAAWFLVGPGS